MPLALLCGSVLLLLLALVAFWPAYLSRPAPQVDGYTHLHAASGGLWLLVLLLQPLAMARRRLALHRAVGRSAWVLGPAFVVSALLLAHYRFSRMAPATFAAEAYTLYLPLSAALLFAVALALALAWRRDARLHSRFMASTALLLVDPVLGRALAFHVIELPQFWHYQLITFALELAVLFAMAHSLPAGSAPRQVFGRFAAFYAAVQLAWFLLPHSPAWLAFARWFRQLPLS